MSRLTSPMWLSYVVRVACESLSYPFLVLLIPFIADDTFIGLKTKKKSRENSYRIAPKLTSIRAKLTELTCDLIVSTDA
ncbi:hypothetical protein F4808DRAFT_423563 [Astrocystis sublimbata]|nr:hypothetical protein F4808DRAFT_423563 [Astrocystis sublimbata]